MTINRHNFEVFLVDHLDGRLSPSLVAELMVFLDQNPDLKEAFDGLQDAVLVGEPIAYPNKSSLKKKSFLKDGIDDEFEYLCIASVEGIITPNEKEALERIIQDPNKQAHYLAFQKAIVNPDQAITYPTKSRLKRTLVIPIRRSTLRQSIRIAATIALLIGVYTMGKIMVSNSPLDSYSKANMAESAVNSIETTTEEAQKAKSTKGKLIRITSDQATNSENKKTVSAQKSARINIEESIPNIIRRIDLKEISIQERAQPKQLAQIVAKYTLTNQVLLDHQYVQQESNKTGNGARGVGVFEIIQFGVQSFGKLIGSDINLKANKDSEGKIEKISFESNLVAISAPVRKKEDPL